MTTVAVCSGLDPTHRFTWSGCTRHMVRALGDVGLTVTVPGHDDGGLGGAWHRARAVLPVARFREPRFLSPASILAGLARRRADVLFAPAGSELVPELPTDLPIVYLSDATVRLLRGLYPEFSSLSDAEYGRRDTAERATIERADVLVYTSRWAADAAVEQYGANKEKIHIVPLAAAAPDTAPAVVLAAPRDRRSVLWIGGDWQRKGGATAVAAIEELRRRGHDVALTMIGKRPAEPLPPWVTHHGYVDRGSAAGAQTYDVAFSGCGALLLPSRADCSPLVLAEAAAGALPAVASRVGGIPEITVDGESGVLVASDASATVWADALWRVLGDDQRFTAFRQQARAAYDARLNWRSWGTRMKTILEGARRS